MGRGAVSRAACAAAAAVALALLPAPSARAGASGDSITSTGPLTLVRTTADLNCAVNHAGDVYGEFFGDTACGTLVAVEGTLYGPANIPAGGNASPRSTWTAESQSASGAGTALDPYRIVTTVSGGGLRLTQTDTYVVGVESYGTRVAITNTTGSPRSLTLYRAGDCYLQNDDYGYGELDPTSGATACLAGLEPGSRIEQWAPLTPGSHRIETFYGSLWSAIGSQQPFPDTCGCLERQDNAAGLSWTTTVPAGATQTFSHLTAFSPTGVTQVQDSDGDGFPDAWESPAGGVDTNGDGTPDLKLSEFGATSDRPDVFVQVGWTRTRTCVLRFFCSTTTRRPSLAALRDVQTAFAAHGVRLHVDAGPDSLMNPDTGATWGGLSRAGDGVEAPDVIPGLHGNDFHWEEAFDGYRSQLVPAERSRLFHFALYVGGYGNGSSGVSRGATATSYPGRDLIVARDHLGGDPPPRIREAGTFMHELGHNLGLTHGGSVEQQYVNYKPNYPSVMNYAWQFSGTYKNSTLGLLDYSEGTLASLNEFALDEHAGLEPDSAALDIATKWSCSPDRSYRGPSPSMFDVDWNCNGRIEPTGTVGTNVNNPAVNGNPDDPSLTDLHDHDDWRSLVFDGGGTLGGAGDTPSVAAVTPVTEAPERELAAAAGGPGSVRFRAPGRIALQANTSAPVRLRIVNVRRQRRTYRLATIAHGVTLRGLPARVTLGPRRARVLRPTVTAGAADAGAFFEVDATSDEPTDAGSAITEVAVVDGPVRGQPKTAALVVVDDGGRPIAISTDGARARRLRGRGVGPAQGLPAGRHTVRVTSRARGRARSATAAVTLRPHELVVLVVSPRTGGAPRVRTLHVGGGKRALLSLLPGRQAVRIGGGSTRAVRHSRLLALGRRANAVTVGGRSLRLGRAQLVVLTKRGGVVVALPRRGR